VGHHGSRTSSTPALVDAVRPSLAVISCGVRNRFGHPSAGTLGTLEAAGVRVKRTDRDGAVVVKTNGTDLVIE
jgi:competence protein ComEC